MTDIAPAPHDGFVLAGYAIYEEFGEMVSTTMIITVDAEGNTIYSYEFDPPFDTPRIWIPSSIIPCASGGYALTGGIRVDRVMANGFLRRLNEQGAPTWTLIPPVNDRMSQSALALAQNQDGDFLMIGQRDPVEGTSGGWICRTAPDPDYRHYEFNPGSGLNHTFFINNVQAPDGLTARQRGLDVAVMTSAGVVCGTGQFWGYEFEITAWADDEETEEVEGFVPDSAYSFKAWDPATETEIPMVLDDGFFSGDSTFQINGITELGLELTARQNIPLARGWSMISLNIEPQTTDIRELMHTLVEADELVMLKDRDGRFYVPQRDFNNIPSWNSSQGYMIKVAAATTFSAIGRTIPADRELPLPRAWSIIPYYPTFQLPPAVAIASVLEQTLLIKNGEGQFFYPARGYSNMGAMRPGQGFYIKLSSAGTLTYPVRAPHESPVPGSFSETPLHFTQVEQTGSNMSLLVDIQGSLSDDGCELGVFTGEGLCVGAARLNSSSPQTGLAIWGDDPTTDAIDGAVEGAQLEFRLWDGESEWPVAMRWVDGSASYLTDGLAIADLDAVYPAEFALSQPFPNPFNGMTTIQYALPKSGEVMLSIYDLQGHQVLYQEISNQPAGSYKLVWDGRNSAGGLYFCKIASGGYSKTIKLILVK